MPLSLIESSDKVTVRFTQEVRGVRVEGGFVNVLMDAAEGYLLSLQNTSLPDLDTVDTESTISAEGALALALDHLLSDTGVRADELSTPELVISQVESESARTPRLTWFVQASNWRTEEGLPPVSVYYNFDAGNGELVRAKNAVSNYDVSGKVTSVVTTGTNALHDNSTTESKPMGRIHIFENETDIAPLTTTEPDGTFTISNYGGDGELWIRYEGTAVPRVQNESGGEYDKAFSVQSGGGNNLVMDELAPTQHVVAQANAFYWITQLHDWILATNPTDDIWEEFDKSGSHVTEGPIAYVNLPSSACNGSAGVFPAEIFVGPSDGTTCSSACSNVICTNTASATILVHEAAHSIRFLYTGDVFPSDSFDEGLADVYSLYLHDQVTYAEDVCLGLPACSTREGDNATRYCIAGSDNCHTQAHLGGEVLMGAFWKMRERMKNTHGVTGGYVADILHNAWMNAYNESSITPVIRKQLLILDDGPIGPGNQGLVDGTPHWADIDRGFADQGFPLYWPQGPPASHGIAFSNVTDPGLTTNETGPYTITADIVATFASPIKSATIHYRVNGGAFKPPITMAKNGNTFTGSIPGQASPAVVEYYLSATDSTVVGPGPAGQTAEFPVSIKVALDATPDQFGDDSEKRYDAHEATPAYRHFFVGDQQTIFFEDFDGDPPPVWDHGGDEDDWEIADPTGEETESWADPDAASSAPNCAGNDLTGLGLTLGAYETEADNYLRTPAGDIDLTGVAPGGRVFLKFQRWLSVENYYWGLNPDPGPRDHAELYVVYPQPGPPPYPIWQNHRGVPHVDNTSNSGTWIPFEIEITSAVGTADSVQIEWRLRSNDDSDPDSLYGGWAIDDVEVIALEPIL